MFQVKLFRFEITWKPLTFIDSVYNFQTFTYLLVYRSRFTFILLPAELEYYKDFIRELVTG